MFKHMLQVFVFIGIVTFGLRGLLLDMGLPGWGPMLAFALGAVVVVGVKALESAHHYLKRFAGILHGRLTDPITPIQAGKDGGRALPT